MTPASILQVLKEGGSLGAAALALAGMLGVFGFYKAAMDARIADLKAQLALETAGRQLAQDKVTALLERVLPVAEKMLMAIAAAESKARRRGITDTSPGTSNPLLVKP